MDIISIVALLLGALNLFLILELYSKLKILPNIDKALEFALVIKRILEIITPYIVKENKEVQEKLEKADKLLNEMLEAVYKKEDIKNSKKALLVLLGIFGLNGVAKKKRKKIN
jgi:hypothetical protein